MDYKILCDASCDLDKHVAQKYGVEFIPMEYSLGNERHICAGLEDKSTLKKFYAAQRNGVLTQTTQITTFNYSEWFMKFTQEGQDVLYLPLSSGLSDTFHAARTAQMCISNKIHGRKVFIVDTLSATGGIGVLCERACRNRENGMNIEENYNDIVAAVKKSGIGLWCRISCI